MATQTGSLDLRAVKQAYIKTVAKAQAIYKRTNSNSAPSAPTSKITANTDQGTSGNWTLCHMSRIYASDLAYKYLWTCNQFIAPDGTFLGCSDVVPDEGTVSINGGDIVASTITGDKIAANSITVGNMDFETQSQVLNSNIQVGGRNLALKTSESEVSFTTTTKDYSLSSSMANIASDDDITISFWAKASTSLWIDFYFRSTTSYIGYEFYPAFNLTTSWAYYSAKSKASDYASVATLLRLRQSTTEHGAAANAGTVYIKSLKLELGNKATDWTPAPEDTVNENLLLDTQKMGAWTKGTAATFDTTGDFGVATLNGTSSNWNANVSSRPTIKLSVLDGTPLWLSFEYKASAAITSMNITLAGTAVVEGASDGSRTKYSAGKLSSLPAASDWTRKVVAMPVSLSELSYGSGDVNSLFVQFYNRTNSTTLQIRKVKLERGLSASEWTPSPEDFKTYVTRIDDNGIRIHPSSTQNNSAVINASGMEVFKGGTDSAHSVAFYGDSARIGKSNAPHVDITTSSISMSDGARTVYEVASSTQNTFRSIYNMPFYDGMNNYDDTINLGRTVSSWTSIVLKYKVDSTEYTQTFNTLPDNAGSNKYYFLCNQVGPEITVELGRGDTATASEVITIVSVEFNFTTAQPAVESTLGAYAETSASGALRIGNGTSSSPSDLSNAMLVDWGGNTRTAGDIYVHCDKDSGGGVPLSKHIYISDAYTYSSGSDYLYIGASQIGYVVVLEIVFNKAAAVTSGGNVFDLLLNEAHLPAPTSEGVSGLAYANKYPIGLYLGFVSDTWKLNVRNLSASSTSTNLGVRGTLTYIWDGIHYTDGN